MQTVAIVGTGLIGASFGLALKQAGFRGRILGVSSEGALRDALARGAIDAASPLSEAAAQADLIYLAQPISRIIATLSAIAPCIRPDALVTDAGSTKGAIVDAAAGTLAAGQFLGGHPLAGKEKRGALEAEPDLFRGRVYVLTPVGSETERQREFAGWIERIGALPVRMTPEEHDRVIALTSHLPQLISTTLAAMLEERLTSEKARISGPGLADMTRLAGSAWEIWDDILRTNRVPVATALDEFIARLQQLRAELPGVRGQFESGNAFAERVRPR